MYKRDWKKLTMAYTRKYGRACLVMTCIAREEWVCELSAVAAREDAWPVSYMMLATTNRRPAYGKVVAEKEIVETTSGKQ